MNETETPLVSVIVPVYNTRMDYLTRCIDSITGQTYPNIQMIMIDDGSTLENQGKYKELCHDKSIEYYYQSNKGPGGHAMRV